MTSPARPLTSWITLLVCFLVAPTSNTSCPLWERRDKPWVTQNKRRSISGLHHVALLLGDKSQHSFQLVKHENVLVSFLLYDSKIYIFGLWTKQNKTFKNVILCFWLYFFFYHLLTFWKTIIVGCSSRATGTFWQVWDWNRFKKSSRHHVCVLWQKCRLWCVHSKLFRLYSTNNWWKIVFWSLLVLIKIPRYCNFYQWWHHPLLW